MLWGEGVPIWDYLVSHRKILEEGKMFMMITHHEKYIDQPENLGWNERLSHVEQIRIGAKCLMVMCLADDVEASPRTIKSFNERDVFEGGRLVEREGDFYVEVVDRVPAATVIEN